MLSQMSDIVSVLNLCACFVNSIKYCAPSLADDITCISTTPRGLQRMLDICTYYANKWRFQFSGMKSYVIQFSKSSFKPDLCACFATKCWSLFSSNRSLFFKSFQTSQPYKTLGITIDVYSLTRTKGLVLSSLILVTVK
jgi:hypothetical protein